jgi:acyl-CoA reductase-like NAD-dependent aldehyde dehydrogenase
VLGDPEEIAGVFAEDDRVRLVTFTGSSEVGWGLAARAARKRITLELGNPTPMTVCADADLEAAARAASTSGFWFAGQSCISVQRLIVHASIHGAFLDHLRRATADLRVGDPLDPETDVGPVITAEARGRIEAWVEEAEEAGAIPLCGGAGERGHLRPLILERSARITEAPTFRVDQMPYGGTEGSGNTREGPARRSGG